MPLNNYKTLVMVIDRNFNYIGVFHRCEGAEISCFGCYHTQMRTRRGCLDPKTDVFIVAQTITK